MSKKTNRKIVLGSIILAMFMAAIEGTIVATAIPSIVAGTYLFIRQEKHAAEPIMPLELWMDSVIIVSNLATLTTGVVLIGISSFLPTYIQGVMGKSPIIAGFALSFMSIGWVIGATVAGKVMFKYGFRCIAIVGGIWILLGSLFFITLRPERGWLWAGVGSLLIGFGMGLARTVFIVGIQNSVEWQPPLTCL
jgi:Na+/melibiose symporter-like transporter